VQKLKGADLNENQFTSDEVAMLKEVASLVHDGKAWLRFTKKMLVFSVIFTGLWAVKNFGEFLTFVMGLL